MKRNKFFGAVAIVAIGCLSAFALAGCTEEHAHALTKVAAVAATCTEAGGEAYYVCDCGKYFSDANGEKEIEKDSWIVAALGHDYEVVEESGVYYNKCTRGDGKVELGKAGTSAEYPVKAAAKDALIAVFRSGGYAKLTADVALAADELQNALDANASHKPVFVDLGGKKLTVGKKSVDGVEAVAPVQIKDGNKWSVSNGVMDLKNTSAGKSNIGIYKNSGLTIKDVQVTASGDGFLPQQENASLKIEGSKITSAGYYAVSTNAKDQSMYGVAIEIVKTEIVMTNPDSAAVMLNVEGTLLIKDSKIGAKRQGVIVRAGTANLENAEITAAIEDLEGTNDTGRTSRTVAWGSGNEVAFGAIVVGNNNNTAYLADAIVTIKGGKAICETEADALKHYTSALYAVKEATRKTEVTVDGVVFEGLIVNYGKNASLKGFAEDARVLDAWDAAAGAFIATPAQA